MESLEEKEQMTKRQYKLRTMIEQIGLIIGDAEKLEAESSDTLKKIHPKYQKSARNLLHYRALRRHDLRDLQKKLGYLGLSRLARSQQHVMASLKNNKAILEAMLENRPISQISNDLSFKQGIRKLNSNAKKLLGYRTPFRRTRIMVTMPTEAADDFELVQKMIDAGMNCARINCAHDDPEIWNRMIINVRKASKQLHKKCKVAMDLAGPKIRTGPIAAGPKVRKFRPVKDIYGRINHPLPVWIGAEPRADLQHLPIRPKDFKLLEGKKWLYLRDTRDKRRSFQLLKKEEKGYTGHCFKTTYVQTGLKLFDNKNFKGQSIEVGEIPATEQAITLDNGEMLRLDRASISGESAAYDKNGQLVEMAHISCTAPEIFTQVKVEERILFDDGKIEGIIKDIGEESLLIEIVHGGRLRADKGINLPDSQLRISGLTTKDRKDLEFIYAHADVVNFSFVNRPQDVRELITELRRLGGTDRLGVILKIETQSGFDKLTEILLTAMQVYPVGVMIARGDLAIETGWNNIGRVQEEILSLSQAAHLTDIWATQVLERLAKKGIPSRAEITDAVMAQRADCVMLNKGPFILEAIQLLDSILTDMESYWEKNAPLLPMMK